jgi:hypothetical protein
MNDLSKYKAIRNDIKPGDIVAFAGTSVMSQTIMAFTRCNVSHLAIVFESKVLFEGTAQPGKVVDIFEANQTYTKPDGTELVGVHRSRLSNRVKYYPGQMWLLPLNNTERRKLDCAKMVDFLLSVEGRPYDVPQALSALSGINPKDYDKFFCFELVAAALQAGGLLPGCNPSKMIARDVILSGIIAERYYQICGDTEPISPINAELNPCECKEV